MGAVWTPEEDATLLPTAPIRARDFRRFAA